MSLFLYVLVMAGMTYLVRAVPFTVMRRQIRSRFLRSLFYYLPYAVLAAMTLPAIFYSTGNMTTAAIGTVVALVLAYFRCPLIVVAMAAAAGAWLSGLFF